MMKSVTEHRFYGCVYYDIEHDNGTIKHRATADELSRDELYCWRFLRLVREYRYPNYIERHYIVE